MIRFFYSILTVSLCCISAYVYSQGLPSSKRDYVWMFGYDNSQPYFGGTKLNFNSQPTSINYATQSINLSFTNSSICDENGNLLFYTNGMYVANANHQTMPNGDSLNPGDLFNYYSNNGYRLNQGSIILPSPEVPNLFYILHEKLIYDNAYTYLCSGLYLSIVDMSLNSGLGDIITKNSPILLDALDPGITAVRHANGRDWWILIPKFINNLYYKLLLNPNGLQVYGIQSIGTPSTQMELGQSCFSPDGSKYVRFAATNFNVPFRLEVFDFDRCSGILSNYRNLWFVDDASCAGAAISPNSRFMYVSHELKVDQYDLQASDIAASKITVAVYDGFHDPLFSLGFTNFNTAQLAPDNRIYISCTNSARYLHVINNPDLQGLACNVQQHSIQLNTFNDASMPNFRLGALPCTICDTLGLGGATIEGHLLYGNEIPTSMDSCWIVLKTTNGLTVDSALTDHNGYYRFCGLSNGEYKIYSHSTKPWGGANSIDALLTMKHFVHMDTLTGISFSAGDVNSSFYINAIDALNIQRRFVGLVNYFIAGDWLFEEPTISINSPGIQNVDIYCLCIGDVNGSYIPSGN